MEDSPLFFGLLLVAQRTFLRELMAKIEIKQDENMNLSQTFKHDLNAYFVK
jgi:hypothetical protein